MESTHDVDTIQSHQNNTPSRVALVIHHQFPGIELTSLLYYGNGAVCPQLSDQQIDIGTKRKYGFEIYAIQDDFVSALLFKLQRSTDGQCNMDASTTETDKNVTRYVQMLVAWKVTDSKSFVYIVLIEHIKEFTCNEEALKKLYYENHDQFKEYDDTISDTWLVDSNVVLKTTFSARSLKKNFELSISISEEERNDYSMRPFCIDLER
jgi:hypothetical protein